MMIILGKIAAGIVILVIVAFLTLGPKFYNK